MKKNKKSKKQNINRPQPRADRYEAGEALDEFSDGFNDFYVDESADSRRAPRDGRDHDRPDRGSRKEKDEPRRQPRKPVSPMRRRLRRIAGTAVILIVIIVIGVILSLTVLFKTQNYKIIGNNLYLESDIISTCGISEGENIFLAPKKPAEERIVKRFPYVESARVSFNIPDTIKIEIKEAVEGYLYKVSDTEYLIISTKGRILNRIADKTGYDLPIFIGPTIKSGEIGDFVEYEDKGIIDIIEGITQVFADNGYQGITEINATDAANISFTYDSRIKVKLGIPEDLSYKIRTAMTIINTKLDVNAASSVTGVLDVSRCNSTKRSYFNEQAITPTAPAPTGPTEPTADGGGDNGTDTEWSDDSNEWTDDGGDQWTDDSYEWSEGADYGNGGYE